MKTKSKLGRILGAAAILGAAVFSPMSLNANAGEAKDKTPNWEITAGHEKRHVGNVKFDGRSDFQTQELDAIMGEVSQSPYYNPIVQHINENLLESGQLPAGPFSVTPDFDIKTKSLTIGGVKDWQKSNCVDILGRTYHGVELYGPIPYPTFKGKIVDIACHGEPDGITGRYFGGENVDGAMKFTAQEAEIWAEAHNKSGERSAALGNSSGVNIGVRRNFNKNLSLALEYAGQFSFEGESNSNPFRAALMGTLDEITDTYPMAGSKIDMNNYQRETTRIEDRTEMIALNNYVSERAKVNLNTLSLVGRVGKNLKRARLEGLLGAELNFVKMSVDRNERVVVSSGIEEVQECINNSGIGYEKSASESKSKVIPGAVIGGGISYNLTQGKKVDVDVGVEGRYHLPFGDMKVGNAKADMKGYSVMGKVALRF